MKKMSCVCGPGLSFDYHGHIITSLFWLRSSFPTEIRKIFNTFLSEKRHPLSTLEEHTGQILQCVCLQNFKNCVKTKENRDKKAGVARVVKQGMKFRPG